MAVFIQVLQNNLPSSSFAEISFGLQSVHSESQKYSSSKNKRLQDNRYFIESN